MKAPSYPKNIKPDAILEALLEVLFESQEVPEIVVGRLADHNAWKNFKRSSTQIAGIPAQIRMSDANMRFKPTFELQEKDGCRNIKIGPNVISFHNLKNYLGWEIFYNETSELIESLFNKIAGVSVHRTGLRYINALEPEKHFIKEISDLNIDVRISGEDISASYNFNYGIELEQDFHCLTRLATPDFVSGTLPPSTNAYIDIDVFTGKKYKTNNVKEVISWVLKAHHYKNIAFFKLLPEDVLEKLKEE